MLDFNFRYSGLLGLVLSAAAPWLSACGAQTAGEHAESNTNWLQACDADAECGEELSCRCGVCTQSCGDESCPGALQCVEGGVCESSAASCQAACATDDDCAFLDDAARCDGTVCSLRSGGLSTGQLENATPPDEQSEPAVSDEQFESAAVALSEAPLADTTGGAWRLLDVPAASNAPVLVETPLGWLALSYRVLGDQRAYSAFESVLYRSSDGVHWELLPLNVGKDDIAFNGLAYGAGRYVMTGRRVGAIGVIWTSADGMEWNETEQTLDSVNIWGNVVFAGHHFFAFGFQYLGVSEDGLSFTAVPISTVQIRAAAYGNGRYLLVGSGPMQISEDGLTWTATDVNCTLPGACITDPSGGVSQGYETHALFAEGRFYTDQLSSPDGVVWNGVPDRYPAAYVNSRFLDAPSSTTSLSAWTAEGDVETLRVVRPTREASTAQGRAMTSVGVLDHNAPLPATVDLDFADGLTCETATCLNVDGRLYLVPPLDTPPLPDRVPRQADGTPLLSDDCPVSSMIFCDDYEQRVGCVCVDEAPQDPIGCDDVSQYQCAGRFTAVDGEWPLPEVAQAGCDCNAVDPNQPVGFGITCEVGGPSCTAPLSCLGIDTPFSGGPPGPQPFICTAPCTTNADCPSWEATGYCSGPVSLRCSAGSCQPRDCE